MSIVPLFEFIDCVRECCYAVTDVFHVYEVLNFFNSHVKAAQQYLSALTDFEGQSINLSDNSVFCNEKIYKCHCASAKEELALIFSNNSLQCKTPLRKRKLKTSTPSNNNSHSNEHVLDLQIRILSLEREVEILKQNFELLSSTGHNCYHSKNNSFKQVPKIIETFIPPPPPPPPPPAPLISGKSPMVYKKKKSKTVKENNALHVPKTVDMTIILQGLKDVKLKRTERSPGGTPMRRRKPLSNDPVNLLQEALKKRFDGIHPDEIDNNKENDSWDKHSLQTSWIES